MRLRLQKVWENARGRGGNLTPLGERQHKAIAKRLYQQYPHIFRDSANISALLGLSIEDIENVLAQNNVEPGSMTVRDGYYEYNIKFSTLLRTEEDVKGILLRKEGRIIRLGDFCRVEIVPAKEKGVSMSNGKRAVTLAVIKQADENMEDISSGICCKIRHLTGHYR